MTVHVLKTWQDFFQAVADGRKTFDVRKDDRGFQAGDKVVLVEVENRTSQTLYKTGRSLCADIGYVLHHPVGDANASFGQYVVFSLLDVVPGPAEADAPW